MLFCVICVFCLSVVIVRLSVPVEVIYCKDLFEMTYNVFVMGTLTLLSHSLTMMCCVVAQGTPSLLQNLPRQRSNQDQDEDSSQDNVELSSLGVDDSSGGGLEQASGSETSAVDGGDVNQGDTASSSHQVILRLLEDGETVSR